MFATRPSFAAPTTFARALRLSARPRQAARPCAFVCRPADDDFQLLALRGGPAQLAVHTAEALEKTSRGVGRVGRVSGFVAGSAGMVAAVASLLACRLQRDHDPQVRPVGLKVAARQGFRFGYTLGKAPALAVTAPLGALAWGLRQA